MSQTRNTATVQLRGLLIKKETEKAYLLVQRQRNRESVEGWVPKSMIEYLHRHPMPDHGDREIDITIPEWLSEEKGFIE